MTEKKIVVPAWEVTEIQAAVEGAIALLTEVYLKGLSSEEVETRAPRMVAGILNLATERLRLVGRALRGDCDARELMASFNSEDDSPLLRADVGCVLVPGDDMPTDEPGEGPRGT